MSKTIVLVFALLACALASPFDQIKTIIEQDECGVHGMETLRPKIENQIAELRTVILWFNIEP